MQAWPERAIEEANLFNPAFCAMLLAQTTDDFMKKAGRPVPFALAFLILPIVLHPKTRTALPGSTITLLLPWIQDNPEHLVDFALRVRRLLPITQEALMFGISHQALAIDDRSGDILIGDKRTTPTVRRTELFTVEARECVDRAGFLGRWFAAAGTTATIYSAWGVAP